MRPLVMLVLLMGAACGRVPCSAETTACACYARRAECRVVADSCWCPSECDNAIQCVCGGGKFLRCEATP